MSDPKRPTTSQNSAAGINRETRARKLFLFNLVAAVLSAIAVLIILFFQPPNLDSPATIGLLGVILFLIMILGAGYLVARKKPHYLNNITDPFDSPEKTVQQENEKLSRELNDKQRELKDQQQEVLRLGQEVEEKARKLKKMRQQVQEKSTAKSNFISLINHELKTPMNAIMGMTNLLIRSNPREDQLEQLEVLDFSAKSLMALISDVLDYSRIESGKFEIHSLAFNLRNLIDEVVEDFRFTAEKNNISLYTKIADEIPEKVVGDPTLLNPILNNLLSNALKFTRQGQVRIKVEELDTAAERYTLRFSVADTGVGISRENYDRIFDKFIQEEGGSSRIFGGAGLGLTICKNLVELQQGKIYLESEKNKGSTFYVELDFDLPEQHEFTSVTRSGKPKGFKGATLLLVEDNPVNQTIMRRFLDKWHINIILAEDGEQAVEKIQQEHVSLVLMDLQMPHMDGYEATRIIRLMEDPKKATVPIIALTAASLQEVKEKALSAGMDDLLTKPFQPERLQRTLKQYMLKDQ